MRASPALSSSPLTPSPPRRCVVCPFIKNRAGEKAGLWLSIFFMAIPFGTAMGYGVGAVFASSPFGWGGAFFAEGVIMIPAVFIIMALPDEVRTGLYEGAKNADGKFVNLAADGESEAALPVPGGDEEAQAKINDDLAANGDDGLEADLLHSPTKGPPTVWQETVAVLSSPIFVVTLLGYAAYTGVLIGFS